MHLPEQASTYAPEIDNMFHLIMWITGVTFLVVELMLVYFLWRYRHREGRKAHYTHGNNRLEVVWTILPALICVMLALLSRRIWDQIKENMPHEGLEIQVTGEQFAWNMRYAGPDGKFDTADDILTLNQLHFPVGKPVIVTLTSKTSSTPFSCPNSASSRTRSPACTPRSGSKATRWATGRSRAPSCAASATSA